MYRGYATIKALPRSLKIGIFEPSQVFSIFKGKFHSRRLFYAQYDDQS